MHGGNEANAALPAGHGIIDGRAIAKGGAFHGMQFRPAVGKPRPQLRAGDAGHGRAVADGHHLNEPHLQIVVPGQRCNRFQFALVDAHLRHTVELDRQGTFQCGAQARLHGGEFVPGGDVPEHRRVQRVQTDVHAVKARVQ